MLVRATGGTFHGPGLHSEVLPGGALSDPAERLRIDPARYYFRTTPVFETGAETYAWLNGIICIGSGYLVEGGIAYKVSRVL
ncbi:DUF3237 family protein [Streptomyces sp. NPDC057136]|uniref:DUF3237 family protein n=1 Tax=Streptomyces sp. NPDC057136 TaxID=3346029 RepID=UPI00363E68B9